jgi:molybdopterin-guanine dinucleotide biosynthesis protein A
MAKRNKSGALICILAGGLSTRMGRDKAQVWLGRRTLLGHVRQAAAATAWPVRVVRQDIVQRCGPLGGILTALHRSRADTLIFLSCDMPFVNPTWLKRLVRELKTAKAAAVFTRQDGFAGFPFVLKAEVLPQVEELRAQGSYSLQALARKLGAAFIDVPAKRQGEFLNVNTPDALTLAKAQLKGRKPG